MPKLISKLDNANEEFKKFVKSGDAQKLYEDIVRHDLLEDISAKARHPTPPGYRLLRVDHRVPTDLKTFELAMLCDTTKEAVYYNRVVVTNISDLNVKPATQCLVWRSHNALHEPAVDKVARNVFFNYLLDKYNVILSDNNQTSGGKLFWERQITFAMLYEKHAYYYDMMSAELQKIDWDNIADIKDRLWGKADDFEYHLAIISKDEIDQKKVLGIPFKLIEELDGVESVEPLKPQAKRSDKDTGYEP